jgi:hypothetical protein
MIRIEQQRMRGEAVQLGLTGMLETLRNKKARILAMLAERQ